ncbi:TatD family hydrolase [Treponema sp.]|uniref:TatD family hydrolase n=1 Tax=Treponema sp. TaxID=166 RepID=UPI003F0F548E
MYCDSHLHAAECDSFVPDYYCCSCSHSAEEFLRQEKIAVRSNGKLVCAFGLHPQNPSLENAGLLEKLLAEKRIQAVGESGFDFFTPDLRACADIQKKAFEACLFCALKYEVPLVVHNRKALDMMFRYSSELKKLYSVVFHSFPFVARDALSLLRHGINAYFSFGKPLLNGSKKAADCIRELPLNRILFETDAPYQTLRGEDKTLPSQIQNVYEKACEIRGCGTEELCALVQENFFSAFNFK